MSEPRQSEEVRYVDETVIRMAELMTPSFENFSGKVHGGAILCLLDKVAYVCACRYAGTYAVTASVDRVEFREPIRVGEVVHFTARLVYAGRTSMDIEILVESQDLLTGESRHTNTCYFTMVAMRDGTPVPVPRLEARSPEDRHRMEHAQLRRELQTEYRVRRQSLPGRC